MRKIPTNSEIFCEESLIKAFKSVGYEVTVPFRIIKDKPDILLKINNILISCECVQIPPNYIYSFHFKKIRNSDWNGKQIISELLPNEPHSWIAEAIKLKTKKVEEYGKLTGAKFHYLLVHPPFDEQAYINEENEWVIPALRHSTLNIEHKFEQIYFLSKKIGLILIYNKKDDFQLGSTLNIKCEQGYPTLCTNRFRFSFKTNKTQVSKSIISIYELTSIQELKVKPIDDHYQKYRPAIRTANYYFKVESWENKAVFNQKIYLSNPIETIESEPQYMTNLSADTEYWFHAYHEFGAPKGMQVDISTIQKK